MSLDLLANALIIFVISFAVSSICIPLVIKLAIKKRLMGEYGEGRHVHKGFVPRLGGVAVYAGFIFSQVYLIIAHNKNAEMLSSNYYLVLFSSTLLFLLGTLDDLVDIKANMKFLIQLLVAFFVASIADVRIVSFYGLFDLHGLPLWFSHLFSITVITFFINAYNLIDGIDSLSSSVGMYVLFCFGGVFLLNDNFTDSLIAFSVFGGLLGFWFFNKPPAKIFMGDSGTLSMGLIMAYFAIKISNTPIDYEGSISPVFAMVVLAYPVIDTLRVFTKRIFRGVSPFTPDRNHIHHLLLELGYSHGKATIVIIIWSVLLSYTAYLLRETPTTSFITMVSLILIVANIPSFILKRRGKSEAQ